MRAFALAQVNHFAVLVAQHLNFDMPRMLQKLLHVHVGSAKSLLRFASRRLVSASNSSLLRTTRMPRPPPPAAAFRISG